MEFEKFQVKQVGVVTRLTELKLSCNTLSGSIPSEIGAITKLRVLEIAQNSVTGTIPETLRDQTTEFVGKTDFELLNEIRNVFEFDFDRHSE